MTIIGAAANDDRCLSSSSSSDSLQYTKEYRSTRSATFYGSSTYRDGVVVHNAGGRGYDCDDPHPYCKPSNRAAYSQGHHRSPAGSSRLPKLVGDHKPRNYVPPLPVSSNSTIDLKHSQTRIGQPQASTSQSLLEIGLASDYSGTSKTSRIRSPSKQNSSLLTSPLENRRLLIRPTDDSPSLINLSKSKNYAAIKSSTYAPSYQTSVYNVEDSLDYGTKTSANIPLSGFSKNDLSGITESSDLRTATDGRASLLLDDLARQEIKQRSDTRQAVRSTSCDSSIFSSASQATSVASTTCTAPSRRSRLPASVVANIIGALPRALPNSITDILPCEFAVYSDCSQSFALDNTEQWIEHSILHLGSQLPIRCMCWFCDDFLFDATSQSQDKRSNFIDRMEHIGNHIREDCYTVDQMRPDYHFLKHLKDHCLISERLYRIAKSWNEGPAPRIGGIYDHDFLPEEMLRAQERSQAVILKHRSGDRRKNRKSRVGGTNSLHDRIGTALSPDRLKRNIRAVSVETVANNTRNERPEAVHEVKVDHETGKLASLRDIPLVHPSDIESSDANPGPGSSHLQQNNPTVVPITNSMNGVCEQVDCVDIDHSPQSSRSSIILSRTPSIEFFSEQIPVNKQRKQEIFDKLFVYVTELLRTKSPLVTDSTGHQAAVPTAESSSATFSSSRPGISSWAPSCYKSPGKASKKRKTAENSDGEEASDDDTNQHEKETRKGKEKEQLRFACPYFKYDSTKYGSWQNCCGPGWPDIHRVKEHLYRRHKRPKWRCMRCYEAFRLQKDLEAHARETTACLVQPPKPIDGFDESQELQLRSRKKAFARLPEYEKWREVYKILFPHIRPDDIPTPFYDHGQTDKSADQADWSAQREAYLLQELPLRIKTAIELELGSVLNIDENIFRKAAERCANTILQNFADQLTVSSTLPDLNTAAEDTPDQNFELPEVNTGGNIDFHEGSIFSWNMDGISDFLPGLSTEFGELEPRVSFEQMMEDLQSPQNGEKLGSDSGYGSHNVKGTGKRTTESS